MSKTPLTLEIIESFGFEKTTKRSDWDDVKNIYTLSNGIELSCLTVCNNIPITESYNLEGLDGYIYITTKEELEDLNNSTFEQVCEELSNEFEEFEIKE